MPSKRRDRAVPRTPGQRLLSRHRVRALSPLPWGGSGTQWRGSRDRPCWGTHATARRGQGGTGTHGEGARLGQQIPPCWEAAGPRGDSSEVLGSQPFPENTQHSMVMPVPGLPGKPNPCSQAAEAAEHPQLGVSLVLPLLASPPSPAASGGLQRPAHSQSPAPPARMTHSSILSVFTLQCQRRQAAWALQWVPIKDGPWQPEGRGKGSAGSLASRDCPEAAAQPSQRNRVWLSPPSGGVWAMPKAAPPVTAAPGARNHHNWERNPASNRRGKSPIALR